MDLDLCQGHARCYDLCPEVFDLDDEEGRAVVRNELVPPALQEAARSAVLNCPERAIIIVEE